MTSDNRGLRGLRNPKQTVEGIQQKLSPPNPQADSPLAAPEPEEEGLPEGGFVDMFRPDLHEGDDE